MSDVPPPPPPPHHPPPHHPPPPPHHPPPPPPRHAPPPRSTALSALGCLLALSLFLNIAAVVVFFIGCLGWLGTNDLSAELSGTSITEKFYAGKSSSSNKIAIIHLDGVIMEGLLRFVHKEIDHAAKDKEVKAVVWRIDSPGGSITASDDLYRRLVRLRDGDTEKKTIGKPLVASMASMAASGGYYVAMPAHPLFAEDTTLTGSIGVYAALPNVEELSKKVGFRMNVIKQGKIKDSGSPFKEMSSEEGQVWQDMIDHAYLRFIHIIEEGRPDLKGQMLKPFTVQPVNAAPGVKEKAKPYTRYRADGGIFTADKAVELGLIDKIGTLEDAVRAARDAANLGDDFKAIRYERPKTPLDLLLGTRAPQPGVLLDPARLQSGFTPRLWFLAPGHEAAGFLAALEAQGK